LESSCSRPLTRDAKRVIDLSSMKWWSLATDNDGMTVTANQVARAELSKLIESPDDSYSNRLVRVKACQ
jgi:hypothetical protein